MCVFLLEGIPNSSGQSCEDEEKRRRKRSETSVVFDKFSFYCFYVSICLVVGMCCCLFVAIATMDSWFGFL
jgi:hypothetical protein